MRLPPKPAADDVSEASDDASETGSHSDATSPLETTLTINVDSADTHEDAAEDNLADLIRAQFVDLDLSGRSEVGLDTPSTARDLYDATPRASVSPEPTQREEQLNPDLLPIESHDDRFTSNIVSGLQRLNLDRGRKTYNVKDETLPAIPVFDKKFQDCLKSGKAIAGSIHAGLSACSLAIEGNSELARLRASAGRLRVFESPATRLIGIVGDSAAGMTGMRPPNNDSLRYLLGKSSLINSLLDIPDLAHKGDHGSAVTSFVTEYHRRSSQHAAPFTIEVEYCNETEIDEQLHELLVSYRELYQPGLEKQLENDERLYREIETKSTVAASTLQSIFPDHPAVAPSQLRDQDEGAFERILDELKRLALLIKWPSDAANGRWTATATSPGECHDKVAYFMEKGLWSLTNVVRIYLSAQVLKTGVVLADLPGYRDINLARVRKAEQYLLRCHEVFIVANINRVISDQSVAKFVGDQMKASGKRRSVTIDIDLLAAARKHKRVANSRACTKALKASKNAWGPKGSAAAAQEADTEYKYLFISARNADVERSLRHRYESPGAGLSINVFCIGNRDYEGALLQSQKAHQWAIERSGVPDLRRFCHTVVGQAQYDASIHFLQVELASLLQSLEVWLSVSEQDTLVTIDPQIITDLQANLEQKIDDYAEDLKETIYKGQGANDQRLTGQSDQEFSDHALDVSAEWRTERELIYLLRDICFETRREIQYAKIPSTLPVCMYHPTNLNTFNDRNIEFNAMGSHISSFILDLMIPTYRACAAVSGTGTKVRMHQTMSRRLDRRDLFSLMCRRIQIESQTLFDENLDRLRDCVVGMSDEIRGQLESFRGEEREGQMRNPGEVRRVRDILDTAREREREMKGALAEFKGGAR
ncbi:MAG: hypothetical protein Q9169_005755 [Polycauliona sp. 2 TL-2023]